MPNGLRLDLPCKDMARVIGDIERDIDRLTKISENLGPFPEAKEVIDQTILNRQVERQLIVTQFASVCANITLAPEGETSPAEEQVRRALQERARQLEEAGIVGGGET